MKVLVTGGNGRLGNVLARQLLTEGHQVRVLLSPQHPDKQSLSDLAVEYFEGDILAKISLEKAIEGMDWVFHLATKILLAPDKDGSVWRVNVEGTQNVAEICWQQKVKMIHCSSHHALEKEPYSTPLDENRPLAFKEPTTYHRAKAFAEKIVLDLVEKGLNALIVSPGTLIGPFDFEPSIFAQALIDLYKGKIPMLMEGLSDYADVRDVAWGMVRAAEKGKIGERYLLTGEMLSMRDLAKLVGEITHQKMPKTILPLWLMYGLLPFIQIQAKLQNKKPLFTKEMLHASQSNPVVLHDKAKRELGYSPRDLRSSFKDAFDWYKQQAWI